MTTLEELRVKANEFLDDKHDENMTTFKNYRTSINYFLYLMNCFKPRFDDINDDNKYEALNKFKNCLLNGFTYEVTFEKVIGYAQQNFKPNIIRVYTYLGVPIYEEKTVKRIVKVKANGVNTHLRRIATLFNAKLPLEIKYRKMSKCQVEKPKYKSLIKDHVDLLFNECFNCWSKKEIAKRNKTLMELLYYNGLRIREALEMTIEDTNFIDYDDKTNKATLKDNVDKCEIKIHQKGRHEKDRFVTISDKTKNEMEMAEHIIEYINIKNVPSDFIFSTTRASADGKAKPLSRQYFNKDIIKLAKYVDEHHETKTDVYNNISEVIENNSSHVFRHSRAKILLKYGVDLMTVKQFLRHSALSSTMVYTNSDDAEIDNIILKYR